MVGNEQDPIGGIADDAVVAEPALRDVMRHLENGRTEQARALCREIVARAPHQAFALHLLGMIEFHDGNTDEAERLVAEAARLNPDVAIFLTDHAAILRTQDRVEDAIEACKKALGLDPRNGDTWYLLGCFLLDTSELDEAIRAFREAIEVKLDFLPAYLNLGVALKQKENFAGAEAAYRRALEIAPDTVNAHYNLGVLLHEQDAFEAAEGAFREAIRLEPGHIEASYNLGISIDKQHRTREAVEVYETMLALAPSHADLRNNLGLALQDLGDLRRALDYFGRAIAIDPNHGEAHFNRAVVHLLQGELGDGWDEYDYRWQTENQSPPQYQAPWWQGEDLAEKHITVFGEQGPGDVVMFAHCLPDVLDRAGGVSLRVEPRLVELFKRSFADCTVEAMTASDGSLNSTETDFVVPFGSLPRYFRRSDEAFRSVNEAYLKVDASARDCWRRRYTDLGSGPFIGVSWRGGATAKEQRRRVMELSDWLPLISRQDAKFVNLQYGDRTAEISELESEHGAVLHDWQGAVVDLDDFAAQVAALDLVVSVANTTVHFAGALHKPVWTLAPALPSWRWQLDRSNSPWYPTMQILRQSWGEPWSGVLERSSEKLDDWLASAERVGG